MSGCTTLEQLSIEYRVPADISFPTQLRRAGIVNNVPAASATQHTATASGAAADTTYDTGSGALAAEALAQALADEQYFDEVVISDSALQALPLPGQQAAERPISQQEAEALMESLNVDFIIALDHVRIEAVRQYAYLTDWQVYVGTVDAKVQPTLRIYLPGRRAPMVSVSPVDSIFWEEAGTTETYVRSRLIAPHKVVEQASDFAGSLLVKHLIPSWKTAHRSYVSSGSVNLRDAAVYVREGNWEEAVRLWEREYESAKGKKKFYAAYNLTLGYEMTDRLRTAAEWAEKARQQAYILDKVEEKKASELQASELPHYLPATLRCTELEKRVEGLSRLDAQMERLKVKPTN